MSVTTTEFKTTNPLAWIITIASKQSPFFHFCLSRTIFHPTASVPLKIKKIKIKFNILFGIKVIKSHFVIKSSLYHGLDKGLHHLAPNTSLASSIFLPFIHIGLLAVLWWCPTGFCLKVFSCFTLFPLSGMPPHRPQSFHDWLLPFIQVLVQMTHSQKGLPIL